jgi:hypothetical protein
LRYAAFVPHLRDPGVARELRDRDNVRRAGVPSA